MIQWRNTNLVSCRQFSSVYDYVTIVHADLGNRAV
jgi:hypothetical protein